MAEAHIGTSGWNYKHWWNGVFYKTELKPSVWLPFFAQNFTTVEINNSFYRLPTESAFQKWRQQVPPQFVFAVKASRFLTHIKRLKDPEDPIDLFFSRAKHLREHLGPVLFQLPPRFKLNLDRLDTFLTALKKHPIARKSRNVLEIRDATWLVPATFELLQQYNVALCLADWKDVHVTGPITADFVYVRRHYGDAGGGNYSKKDLDRDVAQIREWRRGGRDVYFYFNNDIGGYAIENARYVRSALEQKSGRARPTPK